jgi:hypothetical protein
MRYWKNFADVLISIAKSEARRMCYQLGSKLFQALFFTQTFRDGIGCPGLRAAGHICRFCNAFLMRDAEGSPSKDTRFQSRLLIVVQARTILARRDLGSAPVTPSTSGSRAWMGRRINSI